MPTPTPLDPADARLKRLRGWRTLRSPDQSLNFLKKQFKRDIERPYKQLQSIVPLWHQLVPETLQQHARLESLTRGILRVTVDSSAHGYELDRLLRNGLERRLITAHKGPALRRIKLRVGPLPRRAPDAATSTDPIGPSL